MKTNILNCKSFIAYLLGAAAAFATCESEAITLAYIPNQGSNSVSVIDVSKDRVIHTYRKLTKSRQGPFGVALAEVHNNILVSHPFYDAQTGQPDLVSIIQAGGRKTEESSVTVGDGAYGIASDKSHWKAYQANAASGSISVLTSTGQLSAIFDANLAWPMGIEVVNGVDKSYLFVAENHANRVAILDLVYGRVISRIAVGDSPIGLAATPDGSRIYVANYGDKTISVIEGVTRKVIGQVNVSGSPYALALSSDGQTLYSSIQISNQNKGMERGYVSFIDTESLQERAAIKVGKNPIGIDSINTPRGEKIYVANQGSNTVSVLLDHPNGPKRLKTIPTGRKPVAFGSFIQADIPSGVPSTIANFMGDALASWGKAQFLQMLGFTVNTKVIYDQLNTIISDLSSIQSQLTALSQQIQALTGLFYDLQSEMAANNYQIQAEFLNQIQTGTITNWNQFTNATESQTLTQLLSDNAALSALSALLTDGYLNGLATAANQLSGTNTCTPQVTNLNNTVCYYLSTASKYLNATIGNSLNKSQDIMNQGSWTPPGSTVAQQLSVFDQYNNALINQYQYLLQALQQIYTIEITTLYLQANLPSQFGTIRLGESGIQGLTTPTNYASQVQILNNLYTTRVNSLTQAFNAALVSDAGGTSVPLPARTGAYANLPGNWNQFTSATTPASNNTSLFVWQGLLPQGEAGFWGSWNGNQLTGQYPTGWSTQPPTGSTLSINASTQNCTLSIGDPKSQNGINLWQNPGWPQQYQCGTQASPPPTLGPSGSYIQNLIYSVSVDDPNAYFYFNLPADNVNIAGLSQKGPNIFSLSDSSTNQWKAKTKDAQVACGQPPSPACAWYYGNFTTTTPNGFVGQYIVRGSGYQDENWTTVHWSMGLECVTGAFCYVYGSNGICLAGNYLSANQAGSNTGNVTYQGTCPPPTNQ